MGLGVLLVDDHAGYRHMARRVLELGGVDVIGEAVDGRDAIAKAALLRPHLVLLDVLLPDIGGFEVATCIAAMAHAPPVLLISSRPRADFGAQLDVVPAIGFLAKDELTAERVKALAAGSTGEQ